MTNDFKSQNDQSKFIVGLNKNLEEGALDQQQNEKFYTSYIKQISEKNKNLIGRFFLSKSQKQIAHAFEERELELTDSVLKQRNVRIKVFAESQSMYIKELGNSLLLIGRSNLQGSVRDIFLENYLRLLNVMEKKNTEFLAMVNRKISDASKQPKFAQDIVSKQIDIITREWTNVYETILGDMMKILFEKV